MSDEELLRKAEQALAEIDRGPGLEDRHADVLAAIRIRLHGGPRQTLDEALEAAGELRGRLSLDSPPPAPKKPSLEDAAEKARKKPEWPGG